MLLEERLAEQARRLEGDAVLVRERVGPHQLDDLEELPLAGEEGDRLGAPLVPVGADFLAVPARQRLDVERVRLGPADRREVPGVGQLGVERPERAGEAETGLGDRLAEVAARRGDGTDDRQRAGPLGRALGDDPPGALVEVGEAAPQVGREALFAGEFLEAAADLAHRLGPAAGRVGQERDPVALVAEVLGDRGAELHRRLARRDRHVRGVGDEDRTGEERAAGPRVDQLDELAEQAGHLVAAFPTADVDDDVGVRPAREGLFEDRLAGPEAARHDGRPAAGHREEGVEDALAGDKRLAGPQPAAARPDGTDRPGVCQPERHVPGSRGQAPDLLVDGDVARLDRPEAPG